jgi:hypothetical protein
MAPISMAKDTSLEQLVTLGPPHYFRYRQKYIPCDVLEASKQQVKVGYRDKGGRPKEAWEKIPDVIAATLHVRNTL